LPTPCIRLRAPRYGGTGSTFALRATVDESAAALRASADKRRQGFGGRFFLVFL